jgi:galactose mutarotase-like enzyme
MVDTEIMITMEKKTIALNGGKLELGMPLFAGDALILEGMPTRQVTLANIKNREKVQVSFPDFKYLGIWTKPGEKETNYICIEPWSSLPDCSYLDDKLENKHGVRHLASGSSETLGYTMRFGE